MTVFGIDLGTTNSVIARLEHGKPTPLAVQGSTIVPSVVLYEDDRVIVGREARNLEVQFPDRTLRSVKRHMGTDHTFSVQGRPVRPEEASAEILRALRAGAEKATGETVRDVVITVPAYFDDAQRKATLKAGELAGLNVLRLLNEPTAASLVYDRVVDPDHPHPDAPELVMVYDLGGGTFDVSVLEVFGEVREVRSTTGNTRLGGDDFDEKLVQHFLDSLRTRGIDPREDRVAMARLRRVAEETKIKLSFEAEVAVREEFLTTHEGRAVHLDLKVTRREFEDLIATLLDSTVELAQKAITDANIEPDELDRICLVGGSTRIPRVRALLDEAFGVDVHEEIDPDLAVALGAAIQAALLAGEAVERILVDVASHSLGVLALGQDEWEADTFAPIVRRNTVLPATRTEEFYTLVDDQPGVEVKVYQGESPRASQNTLVGEFYYHLKPAPAHTPVRVEFSYTLDGIVQVKVLQKGTDNVTSVSLNVADAAKDAKSASLTPAAAETATSPAAPLSPVERKAIELAKTLPDEARARLEGLLHRYRKSEGDAREAAEEALLDFFLDHE